MALILAIESDKRQVNYLTAMVRGKLHAELVLGDTAQGALDRLGDRVPDLILTSALLSPKDEQALGDRLRRLNGVASHVQMLTLPVFAPPARQTSAPRGGMLSTLLGDKPQASAPDGCDPAIFAEQCKEYLRRSEEEKRARSYEEHGGRESESAPVEAAPPADNSGLVTVDIDLSDLLEDKAPQRAADTSVVDDEPAVYELSGDTFDIDLDARPVLSTAPAEETPASPAPEAPEDDFEDWQKVIDALKRESAQVRVTRKPDPHMAKTAATSPVTANPAPAAPSPKVAADPPRRRTRSAQDEWGVFDPTQAGMAALYERLQQIEDEEQH